MEHRSKVASKSGQRLQFEHYLRTGRHLDLQRPPIATEWKFNPYHDPRDGRFTFAPGGPRTLPHTIASHKHSLRPSSSLPVTTRGKPDTLPSKEVESQASVEQTQLASNSVTPIFANYRSNPRVRIGNNGGPALNDPVTLQEVFPDFHNGPGGIIVAIADNILDLAGPAQSLSVAMTEAHIDRLIAEIQSVDPKYRFESLGFPQTIQGQINLIRHLRMDRAAILYRERGDLRPLQVELLRFIQESTDRAYDEAIRDVKAGKIKPTLHLHEAIGNRIDRTVKRSVQELYNQLGINTNKNNDIKIQGREYTSSSDPLSYKKPDFRIGKAMIDVSMELKTYRKPQIRGFIGSDIKPEMIIIVRPSQLGSHSIYAIAPLEK